MSTIERTLGAVADLLNGMEHDRRSLAGRLGIELAAADRYLRALSKMSGMKVIRRGRRKFLIYVAPPPLWVVPPFLAGVHPATLARWKERDWLRYYDKHRGPERARGKGPGQPPPKPGAPRTTSRRKSGTPSRG